MDPLFIVAAAAALLAGVVASLLVPPVDNLAQFLRSFDRRALEGRATSAGPCWPPRCRVSAGWRSPPA